MGKQGPCYHCGVTSTPLWRNGPPEKPVLCNACGSRWRTKGTLTNYTPLHARAEPDNYEDSRAPRLKSVSIKNKELKAHKRKQIHENAVIGGVAHDYNQGFRKGLDEDTSNRSSSGSAISNSESCAQFGSADASDLTGPAQSIVWDTMVPSRKRTCVNRPKPSSVEKLTKDLYTILQKQQSSYLSGSSEEDLLFESDAPMVSVEIGHGSVLIRHPSSIAREEESEASSLSVDNKPHPANEAYSQLMTLPVHTNSKGITVPISGTEKINKPSVHDIDQEQNKRDKAQHEKLQFLGYRNSPLCSVDLKDVLNFDEFIDHLTNDEQQHLLKFLPSVDTARLPDSLKGMFGSLQFQENISSFQKLLAEDVFDLSSSGLKSEDCKTLKRLVLYNPTKSKWVEQYKLLQDAKFRQNTAGSIVTGGPNAIASGHSVNAKRLRDGQCHNHQGAKSMKSPKRLSTEYCHEPKEFIDNDGSCFSPKSLFALPPDSSSLMLDSLHYTGENSDQDLLLDVPSNSSFPQAELLLPASSLGAQPSTSSSSIHPSLFTH